MMRVKMRRTTTETEMTPWPKMLQLAALTQESFLRLQLHPKRNRRSLAMRRRTTPGAACAFYYAFVVPLAWP
jgi:hypothetical protein